MTTFNEFTDVCEEIEGISSSLEITAVVSSLLQRISESSDPDAELSIVSRFVMGKVFSDWSAVELGVGPSLLYESISRTAGVPVKQIKYAPTIRVLRMPCIRLLWMLGTKGSCSRTRILCILLENVARTG